MNRISRIDEQAARGDHVAAADAREFLAVHLALLSDQDRDALAALQRGETLSEIARREQITPAAASYRRTAAIRRFRAAAGDLNGRA